MPRKERQTDSIPELYPQQTDGAFAMLSEDNAGIAAEQQMMPMEPVIGPEQCREWSEELQKYKSGKSHLERRVVSAENWWRLRNEYEEEKDTDKGDSSFGFRVKSAWLHNVIANKHADYMDSYPMPNVLAREEGDKYEAWALGKIIPAVLEQNEFRKTYSNVGWQKEKTGTGVYKIVWDAKKLNGLGDISVSRRSLLNVFWEPGIEDIQKSRRFYDVEMVDHETLLEEYPELENEDLSNALELQKFKTDDHIDTTDKHAVIDVYYHKHGKLHYAKYVGNHVLYATENDTTPYKTEQKPVQLNTTNEYGVPLQAMENIQHTRAEDGLYDHGLYPYVFDTLYPMEGSPAGYGYIDVSANALTRIDLTSQALLENTLVNATPRYFERVDGSINEAEFIDLKKRIVHVNGSLDETNVVPITGTGLSGNYIDMYAYMIDELRQTSGNTESATGSAGSGVTAASAIAALQEASGKLSRDSTNSSYDAYKQVVYFVIELIRQHYDLPRQFRITGDMGVNRYIEFSNQRMQAQWQGQIGDTDLGYRLPVYDIDVVPQKNASYTKLNQNTMAEEFYNMGFFNPQLADQALLCLGMMDFDGKDELAQKISAQGTMYQQLLMYQQLALTLAQKYEPGMVAGLAQQATGMSFAQQGMRNGEEQQKDFASVGEESSVTKNARQRSQEASQPGGSSK